MKRLSLKATSLILALVLALSLSVTAFADDNAASMTRAEVTQEVIKNMGLAAQAEASAKDASAFKDVAEGSKFEGAINLAYSKGIVNGVSKDAFAPDAAVTQLEAAAMILRSTGLDKALLKDWPADYDDMAVWSGLMDGLTYEASKPVTTAMLEQMLKNAAAIADKPVIGISWSYNGQNYDSHKTIFKTVGAIPVELDQVTSTAVKYDAEGKIESAYLEESGMLKQEYADKVKEKVSHGQQRRRCDAGHRRRLLHRRRGCEPISVQGPREGKERGRRDQRHARYLRLHAHGLLP